MTTRTSEEIRQKIARYVESINHAEDLSIAEEVWNTVPESSFIHPRGHEYGWQEICRNFYGMTMREMFSRRELKLVTEPQIIVYGDCAVAVFDWDFHATLRDDGSLLHTTGRESQVFAQIPGVGWRLVHVHYSGPPTTERGQGF